MSHAADGSSTSNQGAPAGRGLGPALGAFARSHLRTRVIPLLGLAAIGALIFAANPAQLVRVAKHFDMRLAPLVLALSLSFYMLQGLRWWFLLRGAKINASLRDTLVLNMTGQASALLPLGEMTRAIMVARVAGVGLGETMGTITVQELLFAVILIAAAIPGALRWHGAAAAVSLALAATVAIFVILTVRPVFVRVMRLVARLPVLGGLTDGIEQLRAETVILLERRDTYFWSWLDPVRAGVGVALLYLVIQGIDPGKLGWQQAAFVYAVAQVVSAISLSPGGLGAFEAGTAGLLVAVGLNFQLATAGAIMQRLADKGFATMVGLLLFIYARRRYGFTGAALFKSRQALPETAGATDPVMTC